MKDIFQNESFDQLHETIEEGKHEVFEFHLPIGKIRHSFIKREISVQIGEEVYYDITTSSSHGGPVVSDCHEDDKWELVDEFQRAFQAFCEENKIVSEYVRFDPVLSNVLDFVSMYEVECKEDQNRLEMKNLYDIMEANEAREKILTKEKNARVLDFIIFEGKKIWNEEVYRAACAVVQVGPDGDFFPAYRFKEQNHTL